MARAIFGLLLCLPLLASAGERAPAGGQGLSPGDLRDEISDDFDRRLVDEVARNLQALRASGQLPPAAAAAPQSVGQFQWPLGPNPGVGRDWHGISGFVDLNPAYPNQVRDYTCAARSYDTAAGYNHRGIDFFIWPFSWALMDAGAVDVVAAAPGTLVGKYAAYSDRSCSFDAPDTANYAIVQHDDGTIARYLHFKTGSTTTRAIGSRIVAGEYLGKVGSSGISTGPHLHFEVRASNLPGAAVIEPFAGACRAGTSGWLDQRPYRDPAINRLSTHGAPPVFPTCPNTVDQPNLKDSFRPGDPIVLLAAYRDQRRGLDTAFRVLRPDDSVFDAWNFDMASVPGAPQAYNGSYWYWNNTLPPTAPEGLWTFEAGFAGRTHRHSFQVAADAPGPGGFIALPPSLTGSWYDPGTSGQGFNLEVVDDKRLLLYFYGFGSNGEHLWLFGDFAPATRRFAWGVPIEVPMYFVEGGDWEDFDPDAISSRGWGIARLTFTSCGQASVEFDGEIGSQQLPLFKLLTPQGVACVP